MKILHVYDFYAPGNSRNGFDLNRFLAARGHEFHVLAPVGELGPEDGAEVESVRFHTFRHREEGSAWSRYRTAMARFSERFEKLQAEHRFDLLILNQPLCANGVLRSRTARDSAIVYYFLSPWAVEWRIANPTAGFLKRAVHAGMRKRLERKAVRSAQGIIVASEFMRGQLTAEHAPLECPVERIPGAVDLDQFRRDGDRGKDRARFGLGEGRVVLSVRRLVRRMGVDLLLRAMAGVKDATLVVGGSGPMREELEATAASLGVATKFLGYVPDEDLPALYRAADLFVLPTRGLEGFGLVAIEAMACGTPAMGTPVGAIPEVLGPVDMLFRDATSEAIGEGIRGFFDGDAAETARRCRDHVVATYDWNKVAAQFEDFFRRIAGR